MKCINHPETDATGFCGRCGKYLCNNCVRWLHGKTYCHPCAYNIPARKTDDILTLSDQKDGRTNVGQDKTGKLLGASRILLYLALIIGVIIPSCSVIILEVMGARPDIPTKILGAFLYIGVALLISAAFCRIIVVINRRDTERSTPVPKMPSEDTIKPNSGLGKLIDQPTTLGTKIAPTVPSEYVLRQNGGLNSMKCVSHSEIDAASICARCGKNICGNCVQELYKKTYCQLCAKELLTSDKADIPLILTKKKQGRTEFYEGTSHYRYLKNLNNVAGVCLYAGLFLTFALPLCLIMMVGSPEGQKFLNNIVKAGIALDVIGVILTLLSLYLHLAVRIGTRIATLILGIILVIFGIVYLVKF